MANNINLLQIGTQSKGPIVSLPIVLGVPLVIAALVAVGTVSLRLKSRDLERRVDAAQAAANLGHDAHGTDAIAGELAGLERAVDLRNATLAALKSGTQKDASGYSEHFRALARSAIEGVWLTGVVLDRDGTTLHGRAVDPAHVSDYLASLQREPLFAGHAFELIDVKAPAAPVKAAGDPTHPSGPATPAWVDFTLAAKRSAADSDTKDKRR